MRILGLDYGSKTVERDEIIEVLFEDYIKNNLIK